MKKASYILLAMMLIIAVFVSCKAEVIDDSDFLVNVMFSSENNSKGLTWSRDFDPGNYYWSYDASKADKGPQTGTATKAKVGGDEGKGGLTHDVGPFSVGTWNFTLYGYTNAERTELVYEGHAQASLAKGSSNPVKVNVSSKDEQTGTILVSKDIRLTDGTNTTYAPTHFSIKNAKDSTPAVDTNNISLQNLVFSTTEDMSYTIKSGSYVVTIEMKEGSTVYSSSQIYINVYDYQTTVVGGSLDDVKVSTRFEASDGTIVGTSSETAINTEGSTTLTTPEGVTPVKSGTTTVVFPQGALGTTAQKATLKVIASPTPVSSKFCIEGESSPLAGIDLSVFVDGNAVTNFASPVTVTTYVAKKLTSKMINNTSEAESAGLKVIYNGSGDQPTITSYNPTTGMLVFTTSHFSQYYVTSSRIVAVNVDTNVAYTSLQSAVVAVTDSGYITLLKNTTESSKVISVDGKKNITIDFNGKEYSVAKKSAFKFNKGNKVTLKNGTVKSIYGYNSPGILIENYCDLILDNIYLNCSDVDYAADGFLFCGYGKTLITGNTSISNKVTKKDSNGEPIEYECSYSCPAIKILYKSVDLYKEGVSVEFDDNFSGKVGGLIILEMDTLTNLNVEGYTHSLTIKGKGDFSSAKFDFPQVGARSVFEMNGNPTIYLDGKNQYPVKYDQNSNTATLSSNDFLVLNKTSDVKYEELGRAVNNSTDGQVLVLQKDITMQSAIENQFNTKSITIDLNGKTLGVDDSFSAAIITLQSGCLTIEDGIGSGILSKPIYSFFVIDGGDLVINGGTFSSDPTSYVNPETHKISEDKDARTWTVTAKN